MKTNIKGIKIFKLQTHKDKRGFFVEMYKKKKLKDHDFVFHCLSFSKKKILRGLHLQTRNSQAKLLTVVKGKIFDVMVDLRKNSKTFGKYFSIYLSDNSYSSVYIPAGFAHGFCTLANENLVYYCCSQYRDKKSEIGIIWNDSQINIKWPIAKPILSSKDSKNISLNDYLKITKNA